MSKLFYDHLIDLENIHDQLDEYDLSNTEKKELLQTIDKTIHHEVLNIILNHLPSKHHDEFLEGFTKSPADKRHIVYLQEKVEVDIEGEIRKITSIVVSELI